MAKRMKTVVKRGHYGRLYPIDGTEYHVFLPYHIQESARFSVSERYSFEIGHVKFTLKSGRAVPNKPIPKAWLVELDAWQEPDEEVEQ